MPQFGRTPPPSHGRPTAPSETPEPSGPDAEGLSDRELVRRVLGAPTGEEDGNGIDAARELADRHAAASSAYAGQCTTDPADADLLLATARTAAARSFPVDAAIRPTRTCCSPPRGRLRRGPSPSTPGRRPGGSTC
ncbi:hypothetical protein ACIP6P_04200 [Streptomyces sp. NPDC088729]|uniref:hypothetical protein n=1 Tax=Streptomyces sp. NPDC088729 TaxID=3365876 RepID=UPI0037FBE997